MKSKVFALCLLAGVASNLTLNPALDFGLAVARLAVERGHVSVTGPSGFGATLSLSLAGLRTVPLPWVASRGGGAADPLIAYRFDAPAPAAPAAGERGVPREVSGAATRSSGATTSSKGGNSRLAPTIALPPSTTWSPLRPVPPIRGYGSFDSTVTGIPMTRD